MGDVQFYIRIRGTVLGPYDQEKLQALARRGQLSRMHEVSPDGMTWSRASSFPDLFARLSERTVSETEVVVAATQTPAPASAGEVSGPPPQAGPSGRRWFYSCRGTECGPVDLAHLQSLLASGQLDADDMVWGENMPAWLPARHVPELASAAPSPASGVAVDVSQELPEGLCRASVASRPWVLFLAIVNFLMATLMLFGGIVTVIQGARQGLPPVVASGLFGLIESLLMAVAGGFLVSHANYLNTLRYSRAPIALEKAMAVLCRFWIYLSVVFIVCLTLFVLFVIVVVSVGASLPSWQSA